jgi:hypothetical protein
LANIIIVLLFPIAIFIRLPISLRYLYTVVGKKCNPNPNRKLTEMSRTGNLLLLISSLIWRCFGYAIYVVLNATYSRIMYLIIILTIEINNDNNKNDIIWLILSLFFFSQSQISLRYLYTRKTKISEKSKRRTMIIFAKIYLLNICLQ